MDTEKLILAHTVDQRRRGLQESTVTVRDHLLRGFAAWLGPRSPLAADANDIQRFLDSRKISPKSRAVYLSHLKTFYQWAIVAGHLDTPDPTLTIPRPRYRKGIPRPIGNADLALALEMCGGQLRVMLTLAAFEGLRCIEISRLVREDIFEDRDPPIIIARGKGDKARAIPLHAETWRALSFLPMPRHGPVIRSPDGRPMTPWEVSHIGNDFLHGIGIDATMHRLRHWFGTETYRTSGHNLLLVGDLLGHEDVDTTRNYAAYDRAGAAEAVAALDAQPRRDPTTVRGPVSLGQWASNPVMPATVRGREPGPWGQRSKERG